MKRLLFIFLTLLSFSSFSTEKADFICLDKHGYKYEYYDRYGQLAKLSPSGKLVELQDSLEMNLSLFDTSPMKYSYSIGYDSEEEAFMFISFRGNNDKGRGKIFDEEVICTR